LHASGYQREVRLMVDLRRRRFFGKAATAAQVAAVALAVPAVVQAAVAPPASELDALLSRWAAVYSRLDPEGQELIRGLLQSHLALFERLAG
jgi:hypothetical protein